MSEHAQQQGNDEDGQLDYKDTNVANIGSDLDRDTKKSAAAKEEAWKDAGKKEGVQVWRINKFKLETVDETEFGQFYKGDSYIVLHTYKEDKDSAKLSYDLYFWIGKHSTQDEYGTAAYKTVELDTFLDDRAVQYRLIQDSEGSDFKDLFKGSFMLLEGGHDSGFRKVKKEDFPSMMFRGMGKSYKEMEVKQVAMKWDKIYADCAVLIVTYDYICQFNGPKVPNIVKWELKRRVENLNILRMKNDVKFSVFEDVDEFAAFCVRELNEKPEEFDIYREKPKKDEDENGKVEKFVTTLYVYDDNDFKVKARGDEIKKVSSFDQATIYLLDEDKRCVLYDTREKRRRKEACTVLGQQFLNTIKGKRKSRVPMGCVKTEEEFIAKLTK